MALGSVKYRDFIQGLALWVGALVLVWVIPGRAWPDTPIPEFLWSALLPFCLGSLLLTLLVALLVYVWGPAPASGALLNMAESLPPLLWGLLLLLLWPARAGHPGNIALVLAFLLAALPTDWRWVAQTLPSEAPFPACLGRAAVRRTRLLALRRVIPVWFAARMPVWVTSTLVLESITGIPALGSDWMARVLARDRIGLSIWVIAFALTWCLTRVGERRGIGGCS